MSQAQLLIEGLYRVNGGSLLLTYNLHCTDDSLEYLSRDALSLLVFRQG